jgi:hypothetical protein
LDTPVVTLLHTVVAVVAGVLVRQLSQGEVAAVVAVRLCGVPVAAALLDTLVTAASVAQQVLMVLVD